MPSRKAGVAAVGVAVLLSSAFFFAPVVGYTKPLALPFAVMPGAWHSCSEQAYGTPSPPNETILFPPNATLAAEDNAYQACLGQHLYPPYNLTGRATLAYELFGLGPPPFPGQVYFSQGNYSGLAYLDGDNVSAAYEFFQNTTIDPSGVFELINATIQFDGYGFLHFEATMKNIGTSPISSLGVGTSGIPGEPPLGQAVRDGVGWVAAPVYETECSAFLAPGATCTAMAPLGTINATQVQYYVYVEGKVNGTWFFHRQAFEQPAPTAALGAGWVSLFIGKVNQERVGPPLTENSTLDSFAAKRFETASSEPQISDYGLASDASSFFGPGSHPVIEELVLYPGALAPYNYAGLLQSAPIHWSAITDSNFTQYGYYAGTAPYYKVSADCPVTEVPSQGINITQYFEGLGCQVTPVPDVNWLVIILS